MKTPQPGIHKGIPFAEYLGWEAVNASRLKLAGKSLKHFDAYVQQDSDALALGRATHTALFDPDRFVLEYNVYEGRPDRPAGTKIVRSGKHWDEFYEANAAKTILTIAQHAEALAMRDAVRQDHVSGPIIWADGDAETSFLWIDPPSGLLCKGRADWMNRRGTMFDLKTTRDATPRKFANTAVEYGYDLSAAFYFDGWLAATGEVLQGFELICVEKAEPYDVVVVPLGDDVIGFGRRRYRKLLDAVAGGIKSGEWPGMAGGHKVPLRYPDWALPEKEDKELVVKGELVTV